MKEGDIRPTELLKQYLKLCEDDISRYFEDKARKAIPCVGCNSYRVDFNFTKHGFVYSLCHDCGSLFQAPRPPLQAFESFYQNSMSSNYWAEVFFPAVAEARREKIIKPRVKDILKICDERNIIVERLIDVGAGYGIFLEEWRKISPRTRLIAIEPSASLVKECRAKKLEAVESIVERVGSEYESFSDLVVCFEVLEHVYDPVEFLKNLCRLTKPGGMIFISTLCIDGFDLQILWDKSPQIMPPHHINFLSIKGLMSMFKRVGLKDIIVKTPGKLDVDIVRNALDLDPCLLNEQPFIEQIIKDETTASEFQSFLAKNRLSSHAWVIGQKPIN